MTDSLLTGTDNNQLDPEKSYLEQLVGDGRKFKDQEALARGKYEADVYVKTLERKLDQVTTDYLEAKENAISKVEFDKLLEKLSVVERPSLATDLNQRKPEIDLTQLDSLVDNRLRAFENTKKQEENYRMVKNKLSETFGSNLENHLSELGISGEEAAQLAKTNPNLLLKALGVDQQLKQPGFQAPPRNTSGFTPKPAQKRSWSYYQDLKSKNPNLWLDPKINVQMQKDHIELGAAFEDGDFNRFG